MVTTMGKLCKFVFLCILCLYFTVGAKAEAYTFGYAGLYNKVEITSIDDDTVVRNVDAGTEEFICELAYPSKEIEIFDSTPDVTLQRYNEMRFQLSTGITPTEFKQIDADYIIYGCVTSIGKGSSTQGLIGINGTSDTVRVDMSVRIIEKKTDKIVFTATGRGEGQSKSMQFVKSGNNKIPVDAYYTAVSNAMVQAADKILDGI